MKTLIIIFIIFIISPVLCQDNEILHIDPMIVHWNEILFLECDGYSWWNIEIDNKCNIINAVVSSMEYFQKLYKIDLEIEFPEIKNHFVFSEKGLAIDIAMAIDSFYKQNRENDNYDIKTIKLIVSIYKQWEKGEFLMK